MQCDVLLIALARIEQDARTLNLARALSKAGLRVVVIAAGTSPAAELWTLVPWNDPGGSAFHRWGSLRRFVRSQTIQPRVVGAMDFFALSAARSVARTSSAPLFYDMREFTFALGPLQGRGWKQRVITMMERRLLRHVDRVIVTGPLDAEIVQRYYQLQETPTVVMNTPPYQPPVASAILRERCNIPADHVVVVYQGVVHHGRGIEPMLRAVKALPDVHLCIVGEGPALAALQEQAQELGVDHRTHWLGAVPYDQLHAITCSADIGLCAIEPVSLSYEYALPNKLFEYMMAGIPSIVSDLPALRAQLTDIPAGILVSRGLDVAELVDAVHRLRIPATRQLMQDAARSVRALAYDVQAKRAVDLVRELL